MLFLFRSAPEVEKRIHSKLFRKFWRSRGTKEPAYITVSSEFIFWLKRPLTARIIQKAVSRTLKQSDIVLYAGEMQVFAFLRMEGLLFKFAKRAATWNEVMHCGGS